VQLGHVFEPSAMETGRGTPDILYMFCFPLLRKFEGNGNLVGSFWDDAFLRVALACIEG
jgi:hypothetical protein